MRRVVILHKTSKFKFDLNTIVAPDSHTLHLVTLSESGVQVPAGSANAITSIATVLEWRLEEVQAAVAELLDCFSGDEVLVVTHDEYSMMFAAQIREVFNLEGPRTEQVLRFTDKPVMKTVLEQAGIAVPRWVRLDEWRGRQPDRSLAAEILARTGTPAFAKEVAGTCGERAVRLNDAEQLNWWLRSVPDFENFELDEYLTGVLLHVDCVILDGKVAHSQTSRDSFPNAETVSEKPLGTITVPPESDLGQRMLAFNDACLAALSPLIDGTTHLEFFWTPDDEFVFLEIAARSPGGDCPRAYELNSGINFQETFFKVQLSLPVDVTAVDGPFVAWCWYPWRPGRVDAIHAPEVAGKVDFVSLVTLGDVAPSKTSTRDRTAKVFISSRDFEQLDRDFEYLRLRYEPISYTPA